MEVGQPKLPLFLCEVNSFVLFFPFTLLHFPLHWQSMALALGIRVGGGPLSVSGAEGKRKEEEGVLLSRGGEGGSAKLARLIRLDLLPTSSPSHTTLLLFLPPSPLQFWCQKSPSPLHPIRRHRFHSIQQEKEVGWKLRLVRCSLWRKGDTYCGGVLGHKRSGAEARF